MKPVKPLAGRRILITRARHQAQALAAALEEKGAEVLAIPAIEIVPPDSYAALDTALLNAGKYEWLVVTSVNGADVLAQRLQFLGLSVETLSPLQIAVIGPATGRRMATHGLHVDLTPKQAVAESLVESLLQEPIAGQHVLLVRAKVARDVLPDELQKAGAIVEIADAYRTIVPAASVEAVRQLFVQPNWLPEVVTFTSSSTVMNFFRLLFEAGVPGWPARMAAASIGPITSQTLREHGIEPIVEATQYTIPGLVAAICRWSAA